MSSQTEDLSELANKVDAAVHDALKVPGTDAVRAALNEAGIYRARQRVNDAIDIFDRSQRDYRKAQEAERDAKEAADSALAEAEWELDGRFEVRANKHYLVEADKPEDAQRSMTADERAKWKAVEARKLPVVAKALAEVRKAEATTADRRDAVTIADKTLSAARADLDAAIAVLQAWTAVLPRRSAV